MPVRLRVFADANVLIRWHWLRHDQRYPRLFARKDLRFLTTEYLQLEVLPMPIFHQREVQVSTYKLHFYRCEDVPSTPHLRGIARREAERLGLGAVDALHLASAQVGRADLFLTYENRTKPMYGTALVRVVHFDDIDPGREGLI